MSFRDNLKEAMTIADITTKELAAKTGLKEGTISNYLKQKGSLPNIKAGLDIAKVLNVSVNFLVYGDEQENKNDSQYTFHKKFSRYAKTINQLDSIPKKSQEPIISMISSIAEQYESK